MALQFAVGSLVSLINIMIHAQVTVGTVGIACRAALQHTMLAHTLEMPVWALHHRRSSARRQRAALFRLRQLHHAWLRRYHAGARRRLLGPVTAMNGILLLGWSTAVRFEVLRKTVERLALITPAGSAFSSGDRS